MEQLLITRYEAAEVLSISVDTLDNFRRQGKIPSIHLGARVYFRPDDPRAFVNKEAEAC